MVTADGQGHGWDGRGEEYLLFNGYRVAFLQEEEELWTLVARQ